MRMVDRVGGAVPRPEAEADGREVIALVKGTERYIFFWTLCGKAELIKLFGSFAARPDLSFTWYDAAVLSQRVRQNHGDTEGTQK